MTVTNLCVMESFECLEETIVEVTIGPSFLYLLGRLGGVPIELATQAGYWYPLHFPSFKNFSHLYPHLNLKFVPSFTFEGTTSYFYIGEIFLAVAGFEPRTSWMQTCSLRPHDH